MISQKQQWVLAHHIGLVTSGQPLTCLGSLAHKPNQRFESLELCLSCARVLGH